VVTPHWDVSSRFYSVDLAHSTRRTISETHRSERMDKNPTINLLSPHFLAFRTFYKVKACHGLQNPKVFGFIPREDEQWTAKNVSQIARKETPSKALNKYPDITTTTATELNRIHVKHLYGRRRHGTSADASVRVHWEARFSRSCYMVCEPGVERNRR
jgi:hypothetical protein